MSKKRILIVEDEFSIALDIESRLTALNYSPIGIAMDHDEAIAMASDTNPDLILMDINLKGEKTGIDTAIIANKLLDIPVVFLTANSDRQTFQNAEKAKPYGFVIKPFKDVDLNNSIDIALSRYKDHKKQLLEAAMRDFETADLTNNEQTGVFFVKEKGQMIRLSIDAIIRLEALDNYTVLYTDIGKKVVGGFLKDVLGKLPQSQFIRVHRSHAIAISRLDKIEENILYVNGDSIPVSKSYHKDLNRVINIL